MDVTLKRVIAEAIKKEVEAQRFYGRWARDAQHPAAREMLGFLAKEEAGHEALLRGKGVERFLKSQPPKIQDLRIAEFLAPQKIAPAASFQQVLIHAMKREDAAFWAYQALAEAAQSGRARELFRRLAQEERVHRNRLEELYDDVIFVED